jgi:hypothetical protein
LGLTKPMSILDMMLGIRQSLDALSKKKPSFRRGCLNKTNLGRHYAMKAERIARKHGKRYGVYRCPHCQGTHLTTKLEKAGKYPALLHVTKEITP